MRGHRVTSHRIPQIYLTDSLASSTSSLPSGAVFTSDPSTEHHLSSSPLLRDPYEAKVGQSWLSPGSVLAKRSTCFQPVSSLIFLHTSSMFCQNSSGVVQRLSARCCEWLPRRSQEPVWGFSSSSQCPRAGSSDFSTVSTATAGTSSAGRSPPT